MPPTIPPMKTAARLPVPAISPELVAFLDAIYPERVSREYEANLITLGSRKVINFLRKKSEEQNTRQMETP